MVAFDGCGSTGTAFDNVRINSSLHQKIYLTQFVRFFFKNTNKFFTDAIFREEIAKAGLERKIWQYFACLPNIRSVGVMGDGRTYSHTVALRAVTSSDGMTSDWAHIPFSVLDIISRRIVNEVQGVNRIVYDITSKPPATIEWE